MWPWNTCRGACAVDPLAQRLEADVGGIVGVVVDAERRAVAEQDVGAGQALDELVRLALGVLVRAVALVADAALEAGDGQVAAELRAAKVQVLDLELAQQVVGVVVAVDAEARDVERHQRLDPRPIEVTEAEHGVDALLARERRGVERRALVGKREDAHQSLYGSWMSGPAMATPIGVRRCSTRIESPCSASTWSSRLYASGASSAAPPRNSIPRARRPARTRS